MSQAKETSGCSLCDESYPIYSHRILFKCCSLLRPRMSLFNSVTAVAETKAVDHNVPCVCRNPTARVPLSDVTSDHMFAQRISQPFTGRSAVSNRPDAVTVRSSSLYRKKDDVGMVMRAGHDERCAVIREDVMNPEQNQIQHQLAESGSTEVSINTEMIDTCLDNENGVRDGEISKLSRLV